MGMFTSLMDNFNAMFGRSTDEKATPFDTTPEEWMPDDKPRQTIEFAFDDEDLKSDHMAKVTIDRAGNTIVDTGTMTHEEVAAAATEFRRVANKLAHEASVMKKRAYREAKKSARQ